MNSTVKRIADLAGLCLPGEEGLRQQQAIDDMIGLIALHIEQRCVELQAQSGVNFSSDYGAGRQMGMEVLKNCLLKDLLERDFRYE